MYLLHIESSDLDQEKGDYGQCIQYLRQEPACRHIEKGTRLKGPRTPLNPLEIIIIPCDSLLRVAILEMKRNLPFERKDQENELYISNVIREVHRKGPRKQHKNKFVR